jgi:hypothetical protein
VANDLRPDLDQFLPSRGQGPAPDFPREDQLPEEIPEVVRQHEEVKPHLIVHEIMARQLQSRKTKKSRGTGNTTFPLAVIPFGRMRGNMDS